MQENRKQIEIEVKFFVAQPQSMRRKLIQSGRIIQPRTFESNARYDDAGESLLRQGALLRLRQDEACRLTFKAKHTASSTQYKIYKELEVEVDDYHVMDAILEHIGFRPVQYYEKWRETFLLAETLVCLDTLPFGYFLEIEGEPENIRKSADQLGLDWRHRILWNYLSIFEAIHKREGLKFRDPTFDNFSSHPVSLAPYVSQFYAPNS